MARINDADGDLVFDYPDVLVAMNYVALVFEILTLPLLMWKRTVPLGVLLIACFFFQLTHRFFRGLSIEQGTVFGKGDSTHKGASGHETDEATPYSPPNLVTLAKGENPKGGGGWIVYYDHPGGGFVFSVGSIVFSDCLSRDPVCDGLVENALAKEAN